MLTPEEHTTLLRSFEVDRLLKLLTLEAKRAHDGHYAIFSFTIGFKVAFGTPDIYPCMTSKAYAQLTTMPAFPTLKAAVIAALVTQKTFREYFDEDPDHWWDRQIVEHIRRQRSPTACELHESRTEGSRLVLSAEDTAGRTIVMFPEDCPLSGGRADGPSCCSEGSGCMAFGGVTATGYVRCYGEALVQKGERSHA